MDKSELLAEIDTLLVARSAPVLDGTLGADINLYHISGILLRLNDVAERHEINFMVFKEGDAQEAARYLGDPLNHIFSKKVLDYINVTNTWIGTIFRAKRPRAICRLIEEAADSEKWVLITETAPDTFSQEDIVGTILTT